MPASYNLVRNAHVEVTKVVGHRGNVRADIVVNGEYEHSFPSDSRVSKHLELIAPKELSARLSGGAYFFIDDDLVDFRDGGYIGTNGFVHDDSTIKQLMKHLGHVSRTGATSLPLHRRKHGNEAVRTQHLLEKVWSKEDLQIPCYSDGGAFSSVLSFAWNPFHRLVSSKFDLVRQICLNGMIGTVNFFNSKIPLVNLWSQHLDIAARQIQVKVCDMVVKRAVQMGDERASLADVILLNRHAFDRCYSNVTKEPEEKERLLSLQTVLSPNRIVDKHGRQVYSHSTLMNSAVAAQVPAHLSAFDVYNIATEMRTHTQSCPDSTDNALDRFANDLMFTRETNFSVSAHRVSSRVAASVFSDPDQAFFGNLPH